MTYHQAMGEELPHIVPGQPRRSMYGEHNTHDEQVTLTAAAYQRMAEALNVAPTNIAPGSNHYSYWMPDGDAGRDPIRVIAEVGRRIEA